MRLEGAALSISESCAWRRAAESNRTVARLQRAQLLPELHVSASTANRTPTSRFGRPACNRYTLLALAGPPGVEPSFEVLEASLRSVAQARGAAYRSRTGLTSETERLRHQSHQAAFVLSSRIERDCFGLGNRTPNPSARARRGSGGNRTLALRLKAACSTLELRSPSGSRLNHRVTYGFRSRRRRIHSAPGSPAPSRHRTNGSKRRESNSLWLRSERSASPVGHA